MSNPCRLDDTSQNKVAYAIGYEKGRADVINECVNEIRREFPECGYVADWIESFMHTNIVEKQNNTYTAKVDGVKREFM